MAKIIFLGTANAVPNKDHESAHLVIDVGRRLILVDCAGNPVMRLDQAGIDLLTITDLVLTHFHPDHVVGLPLLLMDMWLMGRAEPLHIYGLSVVIDRVLKLLDLFDWADWDGLYPVVFHRLPDTEQVPLIDIEHVRLWASPVCHSVPAIGIRLWTPEGTLCYSSDTGPCEAVVRLARDVDVLIHEATGEGYGHTSPAGAGRIAQQAGVEKLVLIHYPLNVDLDEWVSEANSTFDGEVFAARDFMEIEI